MCRKGFCLILNIGFLLLLGSNIEAGTTTDKREECCKVAFHLSCDDALKRVSNIKHVWWKVWDPALKQPIDISYCRLQDTQLKIMNCITKTSNISGKVKILGISASATLTVEHDACEREWIYKCEVENHLQSQIHQIQVDTSMKCKWYDLGTDVDLTSDLPKRDEIRYLELFINSTRRIGYCNDSRCVPQGWNRLQARNKSLWLLDIREDDNGTLVKYEGEKKESSHVPSIFKRRLFVSPSPYVGLSLLLGSNTEAGTTTDKREECCKVAFHLSCDDALKRVGNIKHVWWKVWDPALKQPIDISYCRMQDTQLKIMNCITKTSNISGKVKILGISASATLTVEHDACEREWIYKCEVENHPQPQIHQIQVDTSMECKWYDLGTDVDLTSDLPKRDEIRYLELFINSTRRIGYCNDSRCVPQGWNRLQAKNKSLWLLDIREDDNGTLVKYEGEKKESSPVPSIFKRRLLVSPSPYVGPRSPVNSNSPSERVITTTRTSLGLTSASSTSSTGPTIGVVAVRGSPKRDEAHNIGCSNTAAPLFILLSICTRIVLIHGNV